MSQSLQGRAGNPRRGGCALHKRITWKHDSLAVEWVIGLSSLYASESEDRAAAINAVLDIFYTQPDQKKGRA